MLRRVEIPGVEILTTEDAAYPSRLLSIELPPHVLFVRGSVEAMAAGHAVAVVGTRRPTEAGRATAGRIGGSLAKAGAVVVSGLAVGIDGASHAAAMAEGAPTVAVLGSGHGRLYPRAHAKLAERIVADGGAVVSEFVPDRPPSVYTFPRRNRLISGLADATVVVEAGARSGALITAAWALEQGRDLFMVPGSIDAPQSAGCLEWIHRYPGQARVVPSIPQLIEDLELFGEDDRTRPAAVAQRRADRAGGDGSGDRRGAGPRPRHGRRARRRDRPQRRHGARRADDARDAGPRDERVRPLPTGRAARDGAASAGQEEAEPGRSDARRGLPGGRDAC